MEMTLEQQKALALAKARLRAQQASAAAPELPPDPTEGMSTSQKILANIGSGMADLGLGARQLFASDKPEGLNDLVSGDSPKKRLEREVEEKRRIDKPLANSVTGGGALQVAGSVLPTLAVPALPLAMNAGRLMMAGSGALYGGASGALVPRGEGESLATNVGVGATVGAALPLSLSALGAMTLPLRGQGRAAREMAEAIVPEGASGAQRRAALQQTMQQLAQQPPPAGNIPLSMAARLSNPELARLEAGSRARSGANWYDFDQGQARAVARNFDDATAEVGDLATRRATRQANIEGNRAAAFGAADRAQFGNDLGAFRGNLEAAMQSADASNPAVLSMLQTIGREMERLGPAFGPEHLATIRHNLSGRGNSMSPNAYASAPRDSVATRSVISEIDNILNATTGNRWQDVISGYARDTVPVDAAKAAGRVREAYYDPTGRVRGVSADTLGDVPKITEAGLGRAMDAARGPDKATLLSDPSRQRLEAILDALRQQGIVQSVKRSATAGGGSNTASDLMASGAARAAGDAALNAVGGPAATVGRAAGSSLMNAVNARKDRALAEALQDEQRFVQMLQRQATQEGGVMDRSEVIRLLRRFGANP